ncbi:MAG: SCP2 sterol-binding domain-containing protein, partial [Clostridia bacterium]|nr:SCP2 sterol-binding domain-containing protein [Clostridia bacterium]
MTFQEKFDELKKKYGKIDEKKLSEPFAVQINMTEDESHGTFYAAYMNGVFAVEPYDYHDHTAMITVPVATLEAVLSGKADAVAEFLAGKITVEGNLDHALNLVNLMK